MIQAVIAFLIVNGVTSMVCVTDRVNGVVACTPEVLAIHPDDALFTRFIYLDDRPRVYSEPIQWTLDRLQLELLTRIREAHERSR